MNQDKAREYFSAHYEGTLEPGLRQSLENALRTDPVLNADYVAFASTIDDLARLAEEEIAVPIYLSDRIATRLDHEFARRASRPWFVSNWLKGLGFAGLGAAAIVGALMSFRSGGANAQASTVPGISEDAPIFSADGATVDMAFRPSAEKTVIVSSGVSGKEIRRFTADANSPIRPFENKLAGTALFELQIAGDSPSYLLAIPGTSADGALATTGSVADFSVALATRYRVPVVIHASDAKKLLTWKLEGVDANRAAAAALANQPYVVDQRENGVLFIGDR